MRECQVRFYECEFDERPWHFVCGVFGEGQQSLAGGFERHAEKSPVRATSTESLVAGVFVGDEGMSLVGLG